VLVGAPEQNDAYVFLRPASGWANMTASGLLVPSDSAGFFGRAVALTGNTAAIGSPSNPTGGGRAYLFQGLGNGLDLSQPIGNPTKQATFWSQVAGTGMQYAVVAAWGGGPKPYTQASANLAGAQAQGLLTAAYILLNYNQPKETGAWQIDQGMSVVGDASKLKFVAIDVEDNFIGQTQAQRIAEISDAVSQVENVYHLKAVIYTSREFWQEVTGSCNSDPNGNNNCANLIGLNLWDVENEHYGDPTHCGDGILALKPFKGFPGSPPTYGWPKRSGNQFDYADQTSGCRGSALFGIGVDLDFFSPDLFQ
jgi:hypothetical protein